MKDTVFIRPKYKIEVAPESTIAIGDIAQVVGSEKLVAKLANLHIYQVTMKDQTIVVLDVMKVINQIVKQIPDIDIQVVGSTQTIIQVIYPKKKLSSLTFSLIWLLLFIGAGLAIMNFHEDVSMQEMHQRLFTILTGKTVENPLFIQVPYSFGLGIGMVLFFNHVFKKRINEEPSPLDVEIFNYQLDLDQYVIHHEDKDRP
ncbi:stage V sporulation protein AA [Bacillus carboniphilus]|uniref:Stage V sporulation protein AA n=1 Tax=Bacillus carboniphilus TaxID=86663 RepID=A0ABY9JZ19_9BACI|nr:stage V sporulation protein AA [Bacillus carboniphilus]WLR43802.1 stage V sporulation protein AA [Bacillus carboniphilus]